MGPLLTTALWVFVELSLLPVTPFASKRDFGEWLEIATLGFALLISVNSGSPHQHQMATNYQLAMAMATGDGFHTRVATNEIESQ